MARDPSHRYPNAAELAADLKRFVDDKPIQARPVSEVEKLWRWCRRNPSLAGMGVALFLALAVGITGTSWKWWEAETEKKKALRARNDSQLVLANVLLDKGTALAEQGEIGEGLFWMLEALKHTPEGAPDLAWVIRANLSAWLGQAHGLRQLVAQPEIVRWCAFSADGGLLVTGGRVSVRRWNPATGEMIGSPLPSDAGGGLALSPDGTMIVTAGNPGGKRPLQVQRWDALTGNPIGPPLLHPNGIHALAFSPDGKQFATACLDGIVRLWDAASGQLVSDQFKHEGMALFSVQFSPNGKTLAAGTGQMNINAPGAIHLWDLTGGKRVGQPMKHGGAVQCLSFSPDGTRLLSGSWGGTAQVWDLASGQPVGTPMQHPHNVYAVRFAPDGRSLVTSGYDGIVRWWNPTGSQLVGTLPSHGQTVRDLAFSPDGKLLATANGWGEQTGSLCLYQVARDWSRPAERVRDVVFKAPWVPNDPNYDDLKLSAACSPDAERVLTGGMAGFARVWDAATGQPLGVPLSQPWKHVGPLAFSPDGKLLAVASQDPKAQKSSVQLYHGTMGGLVGLPLQFDRTRVTALAFSPDGKVLATGGQDRVVLFWDTTTCGRLGAGLPQADAVRSLAFSPDGKMLAVGHGTKNGSGTEGAALWDVASRKQLQKSMPGSSRWIGFLPDGKRLLTGAEHGLRLWDATTGAALGDGPIAETAEIVYVAFRPDGQVLLTAAADGTLRLREVASGKPVGAPMHHARGASAAVFSPDPQGKLLLAGYVDGSVRLWDQATQKAIGPPVLQSQPIVAVAFTPDGRSFLTTSSDSRTRRWPVPVPTDEALDRLALILQVRTGLKMGEGQTVVLLDPGQWEQCRRELAGAAHQPEAPARGMSSRAGASGWCAAPVSDPHFHDCRARDAEQDGDAFGAMWHLNRLIAVQEEDASPKRQREELSPALALRTGVPLPEQWFVYARRSWVNVNAGRGDQGDFARVIAHSSRSQLVNWCRSCCVDYQAGGGWDWVLWYFQRMIETTPDDWRLYADRAQVLGQVGKQEEREADRARAVELGADIGFLLPLAEEYAAQGQWAKAVRIFAKATERDACPLFAWERCALVTLKLGDREAYRKLCARSLETAGPTPGWFWANGVAWFCGLGPEAVGDYTRAIALAELALSQAPPQQKHNILNTLGAVLYRAGRFREAVARLREGIQASKDEGLVQDWIFLAMAHHRLGETAEARRFLAKVAQHKPPEKGQTWPYLELELLRREAETLVEGKAADPKQ